MSSERTKRRHMAAAGFVADLVRPWLTPAQAARVEAWDAANREAVLGKQEEQDNDKCQDRRVSVSARR